MMLLIFGFSVAFVTAFETLNESQQAKQFSNLRDEKSARVKRARLTLFLLLHLLVVHSSSCCDTKKENVIEIL